MLLDHEVRMTRKDLVWDASCWLQHSQCSRSRHSIACRPSSHRSKPTLHPIATCRTIVDGCNPFQPTRQPFTCGQALFLSTDRRLALDRSRWIVCCSSQTRSCGIAVGSSIPDSGRLRPMTLFSSHCLLPRHFRSGDEGVARNAWPALPGSEVVVTRAAIDDRHSTSRPPPRSMMFHFFFFKRQTTTWGTIASDTGNERDKVMNNGRSGERIKRYVTLALAKHGAQPRPESYQALMGIFFLPSTVIDHGTLHLVNFV